LEQYLVFLQKNPMHMLLFGAAVISGGMLVWPLLSRLVRPGSEVGPAEAVQLINRRDALVIDVREDAEYATGHITNSRHIPLAQLADHLKALEKFKSRPIIVNCRSGARAASAVSVLRKNGFDEVFTLRGGISGWQQAGMPLEK